MDFSLDNCKAFERSRDPKESEDVETSGKYTFDLSSKMQTLGVRAALSLTVNEFVQCLFIHLHSQ